MGLEGDRNIFTLVALCDRLNLIRPSECLASHIRLLTEYKALRCLIELTLAEKITYKLADL
jgi:hypothetical protein